jgi:hypothetical protein
MSLVARRLSEMALAFQTDLIREMAVSTMAEKAFSRFQADLNSASDSREILIKYLIKWMRGKSDQYVGKERIVIVILTKVAEGIRESGRGRDLLVVEEPHTVEYSEDGERDD